jgi:hypothetical protein
LNCKKRKKYSVRDFVTIVLFECGSDWIMKPELSTAHLIQDRDLEYEEKVQLQPHIVYLALSSEVKVGVTENTGAYTMD